MTNKTKEVKKEKVSYSAMAGELRKGARLYEVFKHASEAADTLAVFEREEGAVKRRIANLNKELVELDAACDLSYNKQKKAEEDEKAAKVNAGGIIQRANIEADKIKSKASTEAAEVKTNAEKVLAGIQDKTDAAKADMQKALNEKADALSALAKVNKQIQEAKDKFLKTLG